VADDQFARWAAAFLQQYQEVADLPAAPATPAPDRDYPNLTREAGDLLRSVDAGGIPAFVTANLLRIARDNGVAPPPHWTPNEIVAALRGKAANLG
jgi:hypothetical protein